MQKYSVGVVGPVEVGKTAWLRRLIGGNFTRTYSPTTETIVYDRCIVTNYGPVTIAFYDFPGTSIPAFPLDAMVFIFTKETLCDLPRWCQMLAATTANTPIAIAINKCDLRYGKLLPRDDFVLHSCLHPAGGIHFVSARNDEVEQPIVALLRIILRKPDLCIPHPMPRATPPE